MYVAANLFVTHEGPQRLSPFFMAFAKGVNVGLAAPLICGSNRCTVLQDYQARLQVTR